MTGGQALNKLVTAHEYLGSKMAANTYAIRIEACKTKRFELTKVHGTIHGIYPIPDRQRCTFGQESLPTYLVF